MTKIHLVSSEFPLKEGQAQTTDCGKEIKRAKFAFTWDEQEMGQGIGYSLNMCSACYLADKGERVKKLIYGITEAKDEQ
jgi:hypothetical protein